MTDASTPLPLSLADRSQWQQEAENRTRVNQTSYDHPECCFCAQCEGDRRILVLLSALQAQEQERDYKLTLNQAQLLNHETHELMVRIREALGQPNAYIEPAYQVLKAVIVRAYSAEAERDTQAQEIARLTDENRRLHRNIDLVLQDAETAEHKARDLKADRDRLTLALKEARAQLGRPCTGCEVALKLERDEREAMLTGWNEMNRERNNAIHRLTQALAALTREKAQLKHRCACEFSDEGGLMIECKEHGQVRGDRDRLRDERDAAQTQLAEMMVDTGRLTAAWDKQLESRLEELLAERRAREAAEALVASLTQQLKDNTNDYIEASHDMGIRHEAEVARLTAALAVRRETETPYVNAQGQWTAGGGNVERRETEERPMTPKEGPLVVVSPGSFRPNTHPVNATDLATCVMRAIDNSPVQQAHVFRPGTEAKYLDVYAAGRADAEKELATLRQSLAALTQQHEAALRTIETLSDSGEVAALTRGVDDVKNGRVVEMAAVDDIVRLMGEVVAERDRAGRFEKALSNHLCKHDMADWLACAGGHHMPGESETYCSVCKEEGDHFHELATLRSTLAALTREKETLQAEKVRLMTTGNANATAAVLAVEELNRLSAAHESLKGEHERLTAQACDISIWLAEAGIGPCPIPEGVKQLLQRSEQLASEVVGANTAYARLGARLMREASERAAIERQAITNCVDKILLMTDQWGDCYWSHEEVKALNEMREALMRPPSPAGTEPEVKS